MLFLLPETLAATQDDDPVPFAFHVALPTAPVDPNAPTRIVINNSLQQDILKHPSNAFTPEDVLVVHCSPQSVFRVRPATRCSSTLSGDPEIISFVCTCSKLTYRAHISNSMRVIFANRQAACNGLRRQQCTIVGPRHRDALACSHRAQWLGLVRGMGGAGTEACDRRTRWPCTPARC